FNPREPWHRYSPVESIRAGTLWDAAKRKRLSTASIFWPVTIGANVDYLIAQQGTASPSSYEENRRVLDAVSTPGLLHAVEKSFRKLEFPGHLSDEDRVHALNYILREWRPSLSLLHLSSLDYQEH